MARIRQSAGSEAGILSRQGELFSGGPPEGFLQRCNPASRVILLFLILSAISVCASPLLLAGFFALSMAVAILSFLNLASIYKLMLVPLLFMAIPSWLVAVWWYEIPFFSGVLFFLRTLASVSVASVVLHSIGLRRVGEVFVWLRLPVELRQTWTMMVSQVAGFSDLVTEMALARNARRVKPISGNQARRQIGNQMGILLARTYRRGTQLGLAMEARQVLQRGSSPNAPHEAIWAARDYSLVAVGAAAALVGALL